MPLSRWIKGIRHDQDTSDLAVLSAFLEDVEHARDRAAAGGPLGRFYEQPDRLAILAVTLFGLMLQEPRAHIHRHRIEATTMHDASAGFPRTLVMLVDHFSNPLNFTGQVAIVGAVLDTGFDQVGAVQRVGPHRRQHDARPRSECR